MNEQDLEQRARELLAEAFSDAGAFSAADTLLRTAYVTDYKTVVALRAIVAALRHQPAPVVDDARMARALEWVQVMAMQDADGSHVPAIQEAIAAYDPNCGTRTVRLDDALRKDAERYRWLRDNGRGERDILWDYQGEGLDRVIDSEISREKGANARIEPGRSE